MSKLEPTTVLKCAPAVTVGLQGGMAAYIRVDGRYVDPSVDALAILDVFSQPTSLATAVNTLRDRTPNTRDWIELTSAIVGLHEAGVLVDETQDHDTIMPGPQGFGAQQFHVRMLNDRERTEAYMQAISQVVRPGDVVVEIGTGTGILAAAAARAGARRVYAIEATEIAAAAEALFEENGVADRVTLLRGWSTRVELPERADVLISEIIGNEPLSESVLELTSDARARFLKPDARHIPHRLRVYAVPVELPESDLVRRTFHPTNLDTWRDWYGLNFEGLAGVAFQRAATFLVEPHIPRTWPQLSSPVLVADIDVTTVTSASVVATVETIACASGCVSAVLAFFEAELAPGVTLGTNPNTVSTTSNWRTPVWILGEPFEVDAGDPLLLTYHRAGGPDWISATRA